MNLSFSRDLREPDGKRTEDPLEFGEPTPEAVREALQQILSSNQFRGSQRLRQFLRFVVEQKLEGRGDSLKEYVLGVEVFERGASFDPRIDTIVRTEARKLRSRLSEYYESQESKGPVRIEFARGSYAPIFRRSPAAQPPSDARPEEAPFENDAAPVVPKPSWFARWRERLTLTVLLLAVGGGAYSFRLRDRPVVRPDARSIAVLPFVDLSESREGDVFGDGLAEELINSLGQVPGLHVVARTSAFQFKQKDIDIREIGRKLNVRNLLEGSIRQSGNHLRISVRLEDALNGYQLWSKSYDRELKDALVIQREISQVIVKAMGVEFAPRPPGADVETDVRNTFYPEGYKNYLRGRYFLNKRTPENLRRAIGYFQQAITESPDYALAYTGLADCYAVSPVIEATTGRDVVPKIREAALKALALDRNLGDAHLSLATAFEYDFSWLAADREYQTALAMSPGSAAVHSAYSGYLSRIGDLEASLDEKRRAFALDPVSAAAAQSLGSSYYWLRRYDEAIAQYKVAMQLDPNSGFAHQGLGMTYVAEGFPQQGVPELELARRLLEGGPFPSAALAYGYAVAGEPAKAKKVLNELIEESRRVPIPAVAFAVVYIGLGDREHAFEWLGKAVDAHDANLRPKADPLYDPLRSDARFPALLARMGLH